MDFLSIPLVSSIALSTLGVILAVFVITRCHTRKLVSDESKRRYPPVVSNFFKVLINFHRIHDYITEIAQKHKTARAYNLVVDCVFTTNPANVEYILRTNFANYGRGLYHHSILSDLLGDGLFAVDGDMWLYQRKQASHEISAKAVRDFSNAVFKSEAVKLARIISEATTSHQAIDIQDLFMKVALDSIVKILLGIELDTMCGTNEGSARFSNAFDIANELTAYRYIDFTWKIKRFLNIGSEAVLRKSIKIIDEFLFNLIRSKIQTVQNSLEDELPASLKKGDFISRLLESRETDERYLRDMILALTFAGKDTTASTLTWFVYMLCKHPHIQEKIAQEVKEATNLKENLSIDELASSLTEEALDKMQYLHAALNETLRLYPAVTVNVKTCFSDDTWPDGFSVKKGNMVAYNGYSMGRMKYLWGDDAEEFRPERWLDENGLLKQESPFKFVAFAAGPRNCLGKDFAYRVTKIFSSVLLGSYTFKLSDESKEARYSIKITLHIKGGLYVQAFPRLQDLSNNA